MKVQMRLPWLRGNVRLSTKDFIFSGRVTDPGTGMRAGFMIGDGAGRGRLRLGAEGEIRVPVEESANSGPSTPLKNASLRMTACV